MLKGLKISATMLLVMFGLFGCSADAKPDSENLKKVAEKFSVEYVGSSDKLSVIKNYCTDSISSNYEIVQEDTEVGDVELAVETSVQSVAVESSSDSSVSFIVNVKQVIDSSESYTPLIVKVNNSEKVTSITTFNNKIETIE